jgi:uncharacterized protein (DUF1800 family)
MEISASFVALNRFGLGARPGDADAVAGGPKQWVLDQIALGKIDAVKGVPDSAGRFHALAAFRKARAEADKAEAALVAAGGKPAAPVAGKPPKPPSPLDNPPGRMFDTDVARRVDHMAASDTPVLERLAAFWSNHFAVSATRDEVAITAVPYENEAIRANLFGRFRDMLGATAMHPAMTMYLDEAASVGPDSPIGQRRHQSVNENYAREIMELHTLGVGGGYSQKDVEELALALTGLGLDAGDGESAWFYDRHEPGPRVLLGHRLADKSDQANSAFDILANHPATIRHLCGKLAAHFCGDQPPKAVVKRLAAAWRRSGGQLPVIYAALAQSPEAWVGRPVKFRSPQDFVLAAGRALALKGHGREMVNEMRSLGYAPFRAPAPTGWSDQDGDWLDPAGVTGRVASAQRLAGLARKDIDGPGLLAQVAQIGPATADVVFEEVDPRRAIALVLVCPEFQRR